MHGKVCMAKRISEFVLSLIRALYPVTDRDKAGGPNEETIAAMREARAGGLPRFENTADLLRELNEGD
jgi:hypothetical protein